MYVFRASLSKLRAHISTEIVQGVALRNELPDVQGGCNLVALRPAAARCVPRDSAQASLRAHSAIKPNGSVSTRAFHVRMPMLVLTVPMPTVRANTALSHSG